MRPFFHPIHVSRATSFATQAFKLLAKDATSLRVTRACNNLNGACNAVSCSSRTLSSGDKTDAIPFQALSLKMRGAVASPLYKGLCVSYKAFACDNQKTAPQYELQSENATRGGTHLVPHVGCLLDVARHHPRFACLKGHHTKVEYVN